MQTEAKFASGETSMKWGDRREKIPNRARMVGQTKHQSKILRAHHRTSTNQPTNHKEGCTRQHRIHPSIHPPTRCALFITIIVICFRRMIRWDVWTCTCPTLPASVVVAQQQNMATITSVHQSTHVVPFPGIGSVQQDGTCRCECCAL